MVVSNNPHNWVETSPSERSFFSYTFKYLFMYSRKSKPDFGVKRTLVTTCMTDNRSVSSLVFEEQK